MSEIELASQPGSHLIFVQSSSGRSSQPDLVAQAAAIGMSAECTDCSSNGLLEGHHDWYDIRWGGQCLWGSVWVDCATSILLQPWSSPTCAPHCRQDWMLIRNKQLHTIDFCTLALIHTECYQIHMTLRQQKDISLSIWCHRLTFVPVARHNYFESYWLGFSNCSIFGIGILIIHKMYYHVSFL